MSPRKERAGQPGAGSAVTQRCPPAARPLLPCVTTSEGALPSRLVFHAALPWSWDGCAGPGCEFSAGSGSTVPAGLCHRRALSRLWGSERAPRLLQAGVLPAVWGCVCQVSAGAVSESPGSPRLAGRAALGAEGSALSRSVRCRGRCGVSSVSPLGSELPRAPSTHGIHLQRFLPAAAASLGSDRTFSYWRRLSNSADPSCC